MNYLGRFTDLLSCSAVEDWRDQIFKLGREFGFEQTSLAILPKPKLQLEIGNTFLQSAYSPEWLNKYAAARMESIDPIVSHCATKTTPLIWRPEIFSGKEQQEFYEEASGYGIKSGVSLPIHGAGGELGVVSFVSTATPGSRSDRDAMRHLPELSCLRDYIFESSLPFIKQDGTTGERIHITGRELECLKWGAMGKSSWEIGYLLNCSEATVNFHFSNIRQKFNTKSRQHAVIKAINLGLISLD